MFQTECDAMKVDVPVGFLLAEQRDVIVTVDRPGDTPLTLRLRLIPAELDGHPDFGASPRRSPHDTPAPTRRLRYRSNDGYGDEYGGGD